MARQFGLSPKPPEKPEEPAPVLQAPASWRGKPQRRTTSTD